MAEVTFRGPVDTSDIAVESKIEMKNPDRLMEEAGELPISLNREIAGRPYTAYYFNVLDIWDNPDIGLQPEIDTIEDAYIQKVKFGEIEDGEETYKDFIKEAEKATDSKNSPTSVKISKISEWLKFMSKMDKIDQDRRKYAN